MEKISVSIRVRPLDKQEAGKGSLWKINNNAITLCSPSGAPLPNQVYIFDHVFGTESTTFDIYRATTEDIVASAVKGFNGTVFAYGQTSSGKTFTMRGTQDMPGIIPLAIHDVFKNLEQAVDREFLLRMSYMEIYNEDINDLLAPEQTKLQVHESLERGIFVAGLREEIVVNPEQVLQLMEFGEAHRHIGETNMNVHSSRSHTIFRMVIESRDKSQDDSVGFSCDAVRVSVLNLVDLAGSERVAKTGAEGARLKEGTHINKSLMVLGTVINKLSEGIQNQGGHVPYRDSKLTRILQPALGGNARTAVICNITPAMVHVDESRGTLQFASRAIRVTNCAQVNEILTDAALLRRQKKEIEELRSKLKESHSEHFEEEILTLRNTLLKSECERERIALELQEEKRAHAERERKQAQKIENLSTLVLNSTVDERDFEKRWKKNARRETWCPRITTGNILDEDARKPLKEDRWTAQSRDRLFPMPPPFESLLEEDESINDKDAIEVHQASPEHQEKHDASSDKDLDGSCGALPDPSARIHVADRKRKYCSEKPSVSEDEFQEQQNFFKTSVHVDKLQVTDGFQMLAVDSGMDKMDSALCLKEGKRGCQSQKTDNSDSMHYKDEGDLQILVDGGIQSNSNDSMAQQLLQELCKARDEILQYKHQLALALEEIEQLKNQARMSVKGTDEDFESLVNSLKKEKEELAIQLTEAYLQFEEEKAAWAAADRPGEVARKMGTSNVLEDVERVKIQEIKHLGERVEELESLIVDLKSEKAENVVQLNYFKSKMEELAKDAAAANTMADQERMEREKQVLEVTTMQGKMNDLETKFLQERALRETESGEVRDLRLKLMSMEDLLRQKEVESTKERWILKTESLKLQVSLDATLARAEVFHGRLLEAEDDLKDAYEELNNLKGLNKKENNEVSAIAETSKIEMPNASVSDAAHGESLKQIGPAVDAATVSCITEHTSNAQLASCNSSQNILVHTGKQRIQTFEKELMTQGAVGSQVDRKLLEGTKISSSGNLAHTVSFPMRSTLEHSGVIGEAQAQSRPRLSILNGNATAGKRNASEVESMPLLGKISVSGLGLKPPKALLIQKNTSRSKAWPANIHNKENR